MCSSVIGRTTLIVASLAIAHEGAAAAPLGNAFTYQGKLESSGSPVNGTADFQFTLWDAASGVNQIAGPVAANSVSVANGLFTTTIDFGAAAFNGDARWLEVAARTPAGSGSFITLTPRQALTPAPNALNADLLDGLDSTAFLESIPVPLTLSGTSSGTGDLHILKVENASTDFISWAVYGRCTGASGGAIGVRGESASTLGRGVYGFASAATGTTYGGDFHSTSTSGRGVFGEANAATGTTYGGFFESDSTSGLGVFGQATAATGSAYGVFGQSDSTAGRGVFGFASAGSGANYGVYGRSDSTSGLGVFGWANAGSGTTYGVRGQSDSPDGYAGYFTGGKNYFEGSVGIGTTAPGSTKLDVVSAAAGATAINGMVTANTGAAGTFSNGLNGNFSGNTLTALCAGNANSQAFVATHFGSGDCAVFEITSATNGGEAVEASTAGTGQSILATNTGTGQAGYFRILNPSSGGTALYCETNGSGLAFQANGTARVDVLEIAGADLAEKFPVSEEVKPGMVVMIDANNAGKLCLSSGAYNKRVAGIVSGANGLAAGTILGHLPGNEDAPPIALSGRVWVHCDATDHAIEVGDMLTTSNTPGHAMTAADTTKCMGAVIGKAMTALPDGEKGLVLVLVNLQ